MQFTSPVPELIQKRFSCRTYQTDPISKEDLSRLQDAIDTTPAGPFGNRSNFVVVAATSDDSRSLKGLGTYGFIQNPSGFLIGTIQDSPGALEDFGYQTELIILKATDLGLGTCWLGGTFTKSRFSRLISLQNGAYIPSVISLGYPADQKAWLDRASRIYAGADRRLSWDQLFYAESFDTALTEDEADPYSEPLKMVRLAPSASNKQPWRIIKHSGNWHFYLFRTSNYPVPVFNKLLKLADLQRIDMGIAMAHFEWTAQALSLSGKWKRGDPGLQLTDPGVEYILSWTAD